jgi:DNA-binding CsgD family transcriptional regulator
MQVYIIVMDAAATLLLIALAIGLGRATWHASRGTFRAVSAGGVAMCLLLGFSSLHHLLIVAAAKHLVPPYWLDRMLGPPAAVQATLCVLVGVCSVTLAFRHWRRLERAQLIVEILTDRVPPKAGARQAKLSSREQEVLDLIRNGIVSDGEIARTLQISPATAGTHVQNILRKTELHNRHDLMLLPRNKMLDMNGRRHPRTRPRGRQERDLRWEHLRAVGRVGLPASWPRRPQPRKYRP